MSSFYLGRRPIGPNFPPLVIAEAGINHEGDIDKAIMLVDDAHTAGCECIKFQSHVIADEMIPNDVIPGNAGEGIYDIIRRCVLSESEEEKLKRHAEGKGMIFLSTPFSRAAADRLARMGVVAMKVGSGECNNYPLVRHIAGLSKPIILSTGMNNIPSIRPSVEILRSAALPFALLHCTSIYPTPYDKVRLGAMAEISRAFPDAVIGLSDHSLGIYTCLAAVALGASIVEKHFTSDKSWPGPDIPISIDPTELGELVVGTRAIHAARGGSKEILPEEGPTMRFAYASVVSTRTIRPGELLTKHNIWVKRPGTGQIPAKDYESLLGRAARREIPGDTQIAWQDVG